MQIQLSPTLDAAAGEYLQALVRIRPWAKYTTERRLESLIDWFAEQGEMPLATDLTWNEVERYIDSTDLNERDATDLRLVLMQFAHWLVFVGMVRVHPLAELA